MSTENSLASPSPRRTAEEMRGQTTLLRQSSTEKILESAASVVSSVSYAGLSRGELWERLRKSEVQVALSLRKEETSARQISALKQQIAQLEKQAAVKDLSAAKKDHATDELRAALAKEREYSDQLVRRLEMLQQEVVHERSERAVERDRALREADLLRSQLAAAHDTITAQENAAIQSAAVIESLYRQSDDADRRAAEQQLSAELWLHDAVERERSAYSVKVSVLREENEARSSKTLKQCVESYDARLEQALSDVEAARAEAARVTTAWKRVVAENGVLLQQLQAAQEKVSTVEVQISAAEQSRRESERVATCATRERDQIYDELQLIRLNGPSLIGKQQSRGVGDCVATLDRGAAAIAKRNVLLQTTVRAADLASLEAEVDVLRSERHVLKAELVSADGRVRAAMAKADVFEGALRDARETASSFATTPDALKPLAKQLKDLQDEHAVVLLRLHTTESELKKQTKEVELKTESYALAQRRAVELEDLLTAAQRERRLAALRGSPLASSVPTREPEDDVVSPTTTGATDIATAFQKLRDEHATTTQQLRVALDELAASREEAETVRGQLDAAFRQRDDLRCEFDALMRTIEAQGHAVARDKEEVEEAHDQVTHVLDGVVASLQGTLQRERSRVRLLLRQLGEYEAVRSGQARVSLAQNMASPSVDEAEGDEALMDALAASVSKLMEAHRQCESRRREGDAVAIDVMRTVLAALLDLAESPVQGILARMQLDESSEDPLGGGAAAGGSFAQSSHWPQPHHEALAEALWSALAAEAPMPIEITTGRPPSPATAESARTPFQGETAPYTAESSPSPKKRFPPISHGGDGDRREDGELTTIPVRSFAQCAQLLHEKLRAALKGIAHQQFEVSRLRRSLFDVKTAFLAEMEAREHLESDLATLRAGSVSVSMSRVADDDEDDGGSDNPMRNRCGSSSAFSPSGSTQATHSFEYLLERLHRKEVKHRRRVIEQYLLWLGRCRSQWADEALTKIMRSPSREPISTSHLSR